MENQYMISYGPEDYERYERFKKLGFKLARIKGPLYHMDHHIGPDSSDKHSDFKNNEKEYLKVKSMSQEELKQYISTWHWANLIKGCKSGGNKESIGVTNVTHPLLSLNFDKVFLVNLDRRPERLRHALHELSLAGIHGAERVSAVDGQAYELYIEGKPQLTPGMIGCYQSHYRLITEAYRNGYESICVFEDDVTFSPGFTRYMEKAIKQLPADWQFVYLGCNEHDGFGTHKKQINKYWVVPNYVWGTQGFMIRTKEAFRILHKQLAKQEMQIDEQLANIIFPTNQLKVYALFPTNLVSQVRPDGTMWESDVQEGKLIV
jgi:GR25 family glycosyltransferase involved in LPS biosynthesis